jgi:hypothetical protein
MAQELGPQCSRCGLALAGSGDERSLKEAGVPNPSPGDFTVCIGCGHIVAYDDDMNLRELTRREIDSIDETDRIMLLQQARRRLERAQAKLLKRDQPKEESDDG